ncbi:expressed unknown protein [Seminavis robusta]|uniref:Uncharacterized protein n=1 Tax=Seminavis robusta TaxID=568900 RepID=A0A9N8DDS6_9STRA|nr:expressed unknown protein [Seminavis robusta]|eukprot:Sro100_g051430.1 n/a (572) ;mRNA; r:114809-116629
MSADNIFFSSTPSPTAAATFNADACPDFEHCYAPEDCWDAEANLVNNSPENGGTCTSCCWKLLWGVLGSGIFLVLYGDFSVNRKSLSRWSLEHAIEYWYNRQETILYEAVHPDWTTEEREDELRELKDRKKDIFTTTNVQARSLQNFGLDNRDPNLQVPELPEAKVYTPNQYSYASYSFSAVGMTRNLGYIFTTSYVYAIMISSLGWGLVSSGLSTFIWLVRSHGEFCTEQGYYEKDYMGLRWEISWNVYSRLRRDYILFTSFLFVSYIGYVATRWRNILQNCFDLRNALNTTAMFCGGAIKNPKHFEGQTKADVAMIRCKLHKIYRYMNSVHALTYRTVSPTLQGFTMRESLCDQLGLLSKEEIDELEESIRIEEEDSARAVILSWLVSAVMDLLESRSLATENGGPDISLVYVDTPAVGALATLRQACEGHDNASILNQPNLYRDTMLVAMTLFMIMVILGESFNSMVYVGRDGDNGGANLLPCFQPMVIFAVFLLTSTIRVLFLALLILNDPFEYDFEYISVDNLLAKTEREIFMHLRANFGCTEDLNFRNPGEELGVVSPNKTKVNS